MVIAWSKVRTITFIRIQLRIVRKTVGNRFAQTPFDMLIFLHTVDELAHGGTKMIVFGGAGLDGIAKGDIYFLDVATRIWTVGRPADATQARTNMACSVSGDSFIAWGGNISLSFSGSTRRHNGAKKVYCVVVFSNSTDFFCSGRRERVGDQGCNPNRL